MSLALWTAFAGVFLVALGLFRPRGLALGGGLYLLSAGLEAVHSPLANPDQVALLLGGLLALRGETLWNRPRLDPLRRYLVLLALGLGLLALRTLGRPGPDLPLPLVLLHAGAFLVAYLALGVGVGAGVLAWFQDRRLKAAPAAALKAPPLWSLRRLERGYLPVGYLGLTVGLGSGMAWAWGYFGAPLALDPKEVAVVLAWLLFSLALFLDRPGVRTWLGLLGYLALLFALGVAPFLGSRHPSA